MQPLGRAREVQLLANCHEVAQMPQFHPQTYITRVKSAATAHHTPHICKPIEEVLDLQAPTRETCRKIAGDEG